MIKYYLLLFFTAIALAQDRGTDEAGIRIDGGDLSLVAQGEEVYAASCAACHGKELEGQTPEWSRRLANGMLPAPPHDSSGHTWHHDDDLLFRITKYGPARVIGDPDYKTMMPAFEDTLTDLEIIAVLAFIKSRWRPEDREWQEQVNRTARGELSPLKKKSTIEKLLFPEPQAGSE